MIPPNYFYSRTLVREIENIKKLSSLKFNLKKKKKEAQIFLFHDECTRTINVNIIQF